MNQALLCCAAAMLFYGLETAVADWKLRDVHPRVLTFLYAVGVAVFAGVYLLFADKPRWPKGGEWGYVAFLIVASFIAAVAHFMAINLKAGAVTLTLFYSLLPVVAALFTAVVKGELPTLRTVLAWLLAAAALALVATGQKLQGDDAG